MALKGPLSSASVRKATKCVLHFAKRSDKRVGLILKGIALVGAIGAAVWFCGFAVDNFSSIAIPGQVIVTVLEDGSGYQTYELVDSSTAIKRGCIHQTLSATLAPQESRHYVVVVGGSGTGKSTAVRQVLASLPHPVGALYFDCPPNVNLFSQQLAKQLQCRYERGLQLGDLTAEPLKARYWKLGHYTRQNTTGRLL
jgi:hypothetical protein